MNGQNPATSEESASRPAARVGQVVYPVADVEQAVAFFTRAFGFAEKFVDGDRYAALDGGGTTWALAGPEEDLAGVVAAAVKVADVEDALRQVVDAGGAVIQPAAQGPHEVRAVVRDPWGNAVIVYAAL